MTEQEAIEIMEEVKALDDSLYAYDPAYMEALEIAISASKEVQRYREIGSVGEIKQAIGVLSLSENDIIKTFHELNEYRKIGTVEQVKNQKGNLNVAYQIISDYEQYGTIEDFKKAQRYMRLVNAHGTIGRVIDSCAEYESVGTVEECREAVEKQKAMKPKEILRHRGGFEIQHCPNCNTDYQVDRRYEITDGYCPVCGKLLDSVFKNYCANCGQAIENENLEEMENENKIYEHE